MHSTPQWTSVNKSPISKGDLRPNARMQPSRAAICQPGVAAFAQATPTPRKGKEREDLQINGVDGQITPFATSASDVSTANPRWKDIISL
ncbi:MAG: hypothetical protein Q9170_003074 [Blastenia crenularia]